MSPGSSWPSYLPPSAIARCGGLRVRQAPRRVAAPVDALAAEHVVGWRAAEILRGNLLQLQPRVDRARQIRPRHRVRRLAADRHRRPRNVLRRAAPVDDDLVPGHRQRVGGDAREIHARMRAEIADARLDVELAVGTNRHQAVEANRARAVRADRDADAADLRPLALAGPRLALVPLEELGAAVERLLHECAGDMPALSVRARRPVERLAFRRVDAPDRDLIEPQLLRRLGDDRLHDGVGLHRAGRALLRARRRVGDDGDAAPPHRERLPDERGGVGGRAVIAHRAVRTVVLDDEQIERGDASVLAKPAFARPTMPVRARPK